MHANTTLRHDWTLEEVTALFDLPFNDLLFQAHTEHRKHFDPNAVQVSTLLSIKTGSCSEDCGYCSQSAHHKGVDLEKENLVEMNEVIRAATTARDNGASRFCMGAAWRNPNKRDFPKVIKMVKAVNDLGMETCMTLGMLTPEQTNELKAAGLDYYNHNLDTSPEYYEKVITTRSYQDRLDTLEQVREAGINVCSGGIVGMGEERKDRVGLLAQLANLPKHPESVPINMLVAIPGTPLGDVPRLEPVEFVRTIAVARLMMPESFVRLSAGRTEMNDETQALCFFAGANSIFYGEKLLTTPNPKSNSDMELFGRLGLHPLELERKSAAVQA